MSFESQKSDKGQETERTPENLIMEHINGELNRAEEDFRKDTRWVKISSAIGWPSLLVGLTVAAMKAHGANFEVNPEVFQSVDAAWQFLLRHSQEIGMITFGISSLMGNKADMNEALQELMAKRENILKPYLKDTIVVSLR